jgi:hypothetical protein
MITRTKIRTIQDKIQRAIAEIEKEEDVEISFGSRRFDSSMYSTKMTVKTTAQDESTVIAVDSVNTRMSQSYGFSENIIGKTFTINGNRHIITEFKTRNRKYPIITQSNGRGYKHTTSQIKTHIA